MSKQRLLAVFENVVLIIICRIIDRKAGCAQRRRKNPNVLRPPRRFLFFSGADLPTQTNTIWLRPDKHTAAVEATCAELAVI